MMKEGERDVKEESKRGKELRVARAGHSVRKAKKLLEQR
jgi:hypothetical protein